MHFSLLFLVSLLNFIAVARPNYDSVSILLSNEPTIIGLADKAIGSSEYNTIMAYWKDRIGTLLSDTQSELYISAPLHVGGRLRHLNFLLVDQAMISNIYAVNQAENLYSSIAEIFHDTDIEIQLLVCEKTDPIIKNKMERIYAS